MPWPQISSFSPCSESSFHRHTYIQTYRLTDRQTDRQTHKLQFSVLTSMKVQRQLFIVYYIYCIIIVPYVLATDILFFIMLSRYRQTVSPYLLVHTSSKIFIVDYNYCIIIATYTLATVLPRTTRSILENYPPKSRALSTDVQTSLV